MEYVGTDFADESPLEPGVWLIPAHATDIAPPEPSSGFVRVFTGSGWSYQSIDEPGSDPVETPEDFVPNKISRRQFFQQLAMSGMITTEEALAAVQVNAIPAAMNAFLDTMEPAAKFSAQMNLCGASVFERDHPLVIAYASTMGLTSEQIDALWKAAYAL